MIYVNQTQMLELKEKTSKTRFAIALNLQNMFDLKWGPMHRTMPQKHLRFPELLLITLTQRNFYTTQYTRNYACNICKFSLF